MTYFLPMRLVKLTVTRTPADAADLIKKRDAKVADRDAAKAVLDDATAKRKDAEVKRKAFKPDPTDVATSDKKRAELDKAVADTAAKEVIAKGLLDPLLTTMNQLTLEIAAAQQGNDCSYVASLEALPLQADPAQRYVASYLHTILRDDHNILTTGQNGLLSSANVVTTDRTGDILVEIGNAVAVFASGGVGGLGRDGKPHAGSCAALPPKFTRIFDPATELAGFDTATALPFQPSFAPSSIKGDDDADNKPAPVNGPAPNARPACSSSSSVNDDLCRSGFPIRVAMDLQSRYDLSEPLRWNTGRVPGQATIGPGLYYRSLVPTVLTLLQGSETGAWQPIDAAIVSLPQAGPISFIPLKASTFVKTTSDVTFTDGVVVSWTSDRPSEGMEVVRLPLRILTSALGSVSGIVKLRVDYKTQSKGLSDADTALIASQSAQIKSLEGYRTLVDCVRKARESGNESDACF